MIDPFRPRAAMPSIPQRTSMAESRLPDPPDLVIEVYDKAAGRDSVSVVGCAGPPETVAAWMRAYADLLAPATRVSYHGIHPTHRNDEEDR